MLKKTCPNGHVYDQSIYGDTCPLCPSSANTGINPTPNMTVAAPGGTPGAHTKVVTPSNSVSGYPGGFPNMQSQIDPTGSTKVAPNLQQNVQGTPQPQGPAAGARTTIRRPTGMGGAGKSEGDSRKLVGFLVTYNRTPMGKAFNIYEGRNYVGRDASCDISIPDDNQMSGKHMLIRYLSGNNKFSFKDEMSSNGTYVNKELLDEGELQNYDIIRVGSTLFIFIAIPQI